jgi:DNA-binding HxlR family transcriptional regulator
MAGTESDSVPRAPEEPTTNQVLEVMNSCEPYVVADLQDEFSDASRWTLQRRLDALVENGKLQKKKHTSNRVSYWIPA